MTLSVERRKDACRRALISMVTKLGDDRRTGICFDAADYDFADLPTTTWRELLDAGMTEVWGRDKYVLTAEGWLTGLRLSGDLATATTRERATITVRALKAKVKGRSDVYDCFVDIRKLAAETGLPIGWLWNAIESTLPQKIFPKDRMNAKIEKTVVRIPPTFGTDPVEIL